MEFVRDRKMSVGGSKKRGWKSGSGSPERGVVEGRPPGGGRTHWLVHNNMAADGW